MMNEITKDRPISEQLVEIIDNEPEMTVTSDVVYGLDYEYKQLQTENKQLKDTLTKAKHEIERKLTFCSAEAEGHINPEKCNIAIHFLKKLLDELKEVQ